MATSKVTTPRPPLVGEATTFLDTEQPNDPADFVWSPDGAELAVEEPGQLVGLWDAATGARRTAIPVPGAVLSLRFTPDGATLLVVTVRGAAAFRSATGECLRFVAAASRRGAMRAAFGGPGLVATVDADGLVRAVDIATGELRWELAAGDLATFDPAVTAADRLITRSGSDVAIRRFDTGAIHATVRPPEAGWQAHMSPDGRSAVFVAPDRRSYALADADGGQVRFREAIRGNSAYVSAMIPASARPKPGDGDPAKLAEVVFSDDGSTAAVSYDPPDSTYGISGKRYAAVFIDVASGKPRRLSDTIGAGGVFGGGARQFYTTGGLIDDPVVAVEVGTGKRRPLPIDRWSLANSAVSRSERELAVLEWEEVRVLDVNSGAVRFSVPVIPYASDAIRKSERPVMDAAVDGSADRVVFGGGLGARMAGGKRVGASGGMVARWDVRPGRLQAIALPFRPERLAWLPGDGGIASVERDLDGYSLHLAARDAFLDERWSAAVDDEDFVASPDGRWLALSDNDAVRILSVVSGKQRANHPDQPINVAAFDPRSKLLAVGSFRRGVTVFGAADGRQVATVETPAGHIWFLPDGTLVVDEPGKLVFYDPLSGAPTGEVTVPSEDLAAISRDGTVVLFAGGAIVETRTGAVRARLPSGRSPFASNARVLSPDGEYVALGYEAAATIEIRATRDGAVVRRIISPPDAKLGGFSADHQWLLILTLTGVELLRVRDGAALHAGLVAPPGARDDAMPTVGHAIWLASGHFEADAVASPHVRVWTSSGLASGNERVPFAREGVTADFSALEEDI